MSAPMRLPINARQRDIITFVAKAGLVDLDVLAGRFFREQHESLLEAKPRALVALKRLALQEYLQARPVVLDAVQVMLRKDLKRFERFAQKHYLTLVYCITPRAAWDFNMPLPPTLRERFVEHNLKTMSAIVELEKRINTSGQGRVVDFKMESELVREQFKGKVFDAKTQNILPMFPDAQLSVKRPDGSIEQLNVEYVSRKYTDAMIRQKAEALARSTVWAVPNEATAARVRSITGQEPVLV